jgi:putative isomerase
VSKAGFPLCVLSATALALGVGCEPPTPLIEGPAADLRHEFVDILGHRGVPAASEDWSLAAFSDQGSWHGFALPSAHRPDSWGAYPGPFLMAEGRWLGPWQGQLTLRDTESNRLIPFAEAEGFRAYALPGSLHQDSRIEDFEISHRLWFASSTTALVQVVIVNRGPHRRVLDIGWCGSLFPDVATAAAIDGGIEIRSEGGSRLRIDADRGVREAEARTDGWSLALAGSHVIEPGQTLELSIGLSASVAGDPPPGRDEVRSLLTEPGHSRTANVERWQRYLSAIDRGRGAEDSLRALAVKSLVTLVNNWRGPAGRMRHGSLFPSSNVGYFNGFWAWDSWKHAVGLVRFDPELAKEQIRAMFDHQDEHGMVADVVYLDPEEDNWRDTKPPLAGWAIETVFELTGDVELVRELYPKLVAYHEFWYADRDHDRDGLCEYGSTDGTLVAARWESGMDNAVRFDHTEMLENRPGAWSMDQESVDLNSYLYREKRALEKLAAALGLPGEAQHWTSEAEELRVAIQETMFDPATGWFYDTNIVSGAIVPVQGPEGWTPLWTGVATGEQAAAVRTSMLDPKKFRTRVPFPTVAADDPGFSDGYWRGLVWLDQVYFAIDGLRRYGYHEDAAELSRQVFDNLEGALAPGAALRENYHPLTGAGQNVKHFSWTAAHLLLLVLELEEDVEETGR